MLYVAICGYYNYILHNVGSKKINNTATLNCDENFYNDSGVCLPVCTQWSQLSKTAQTVYSVLIEAVPIIALIGGVTHIVAVFISYRTSLWVH